MAQTITSPLSTSPHFLQLQRSLSKLQDQLRALQFHHTILISWEDIYYTSPDTQELIPIHRVHDPAFEELDSSDFPSSDISPLPSPLSILPFSSSSSPIINPSQSPSSPPPNSFTPKMFNNLPFISDDPLFIPPLIQEPTLPDNIVGLIVGECTRPLKVREPKIDLPSSVNTTFEEAVHLGKLLLKRRTRALIKFCCYYRLGQLWNQVLSSSDIKKIGTLLGLTKQQLQYRRKTAQVVYQVFSICGSAYMGQVKYISPHNFYKLSPNELEDIIKRLQDFFNPTSSSFSKENPSASTTQELMAEVFGSPPTDSLSPFTFPDFEVEETSSNSSPLVL